MSEFLNQIGCGDQAEFVDQLLETAALSRQISEIDRSDIQENQKPFRRKKRTKKHKPLLHIKQIYSQRLQRLLLVTKRTTQTKPIECRAQFQNQSKCPDYASSKPPQLSLPSEAVQPKPVSLFLPRQVKQSNSILKQILKIQNNIKQRVTEKHNNFLDSYADHRSNTSQRSQPSLSTNTIVPLEARDKDDQKFRKSSRGTHPEFVRSMTPNPFPKRPVTSVQVRKFQKATTPNVTQSHSALNTKNTFKQQLNESFKQSGCSTSEASYLAYQSYGLCKLASRSPKLKSAVLKREPTSDYQASSFKFSNSQLYLPKHVSQRAVPYQLSIPFLPSSIRIPEPLQKAESQPLKFVKVRMFKQRQLLSAAAGQLLPVLGAHENKNIIIY